MCTRSSWMLMNHVLGSGDRLNIDGLARSVGISPTPVREGLARVESEGLIIKAPQRGYTVAPLISPGQLQELIELRLLMEPATPPWTRSAPPSSRPTSCGRSPA